MDRTLYLKINYGEGKLSYQVGEKNIPPWPRGWPWKFLDYFNLPRPPETVWGPLLPISGKEELASKIVGLLKQRDSLSLSFRPHSLNIALHQAEHYLSEIVRKEFPYVKLPFENMRAQP